MNHHIWRITNALQYKHIVAASLVLVLLLSLIFASACTAEDKAIPVNSPSDISPTDSDEGWSDEYWQQVEQKMSAFKSQFPTDAIPLYWQAWRAYQKGSPDKAVSAVREALKLKLEVYFLPSPIPLAITCPVAL